MLKYARSNKCSPSVHILIIKLQLLPNIYLFLVIFWLKGRSFIIIKPKLTDINDDCLEQIFSYLDIKDFVNIAHTNKDLKPAADRAFARKFAKTTFNVDTADWKYFVLAETYDLQTSLRLLRCFGHLILTLQIFNLNLSKWCGSKIAQYVNEYCSQLLKLKVCSSSGKTIDRLANRNLLKVEELEITCGVNNCLGIGDRFIIFRRLKKLRINNNNKSSHGFTSKILISSYHLEDFTYTFYKFTMQRHFLDFFMKNQSITKLSFVSRYASGNMLTWEDCEEIATALPSLQEINFKNIRLSELEVIPFIKLCKSLKSFGFHMTDRTEFNRLKAVLGNEWHATIVDSHDFSVKIELIG